MTDCLLCFESLGQGWVGLEEFEGMIYSKERSFFYLFVINLIKIGLLLVKFKFVGVPNIFCL